jgi:alkylation response protein AidB-like acyl-CoA dehydrogenase
LDVDLPEDVELLQRTVRRFVDERLRPCAHDIEERDSIPSELIRAMGDVGLFGVGLPERYGGYGFGRLGYCVALEQIGRVNGAIANVIGASTSLCANAINIAGPDELRERYLPDLASARKLGAYGLSEPNAGSDAGGLSTTARRVGAGYVINGRKTFITNAPIADAFVVFANANVARGARGIAAFVVDRGVDGLEIGPSDAKMGLRGSTTAQLVLSDVHVGLEQRLGGEDEGWVIAMKTLDVGRLGLAAYSLGAAQELLEEAVKYAKQRQQFGRPISVNQGIQWL